ncbi:MAG TPA: potassium channel family protein [Gaiellaceae bacterium]|nr:potassium channel family protein [Gaiellaceae bacterium]
MARMRPERLSRVGEKVKGAARPNLIERRMSKFLREPPSVRLAASVIVTATAIVVVGGGALIRILDPGEYSSIWIGMWWSLQTVTTVGYGDVTPHKTIGRLVGAFVMLEGIAFLAIITAAITSTFVARAQHEQALADEEEIDAVVAKMESRFDQVDDRLERLDSMMSELAKRQ